MPPVNPWSGPWLHVVSGWWTIPQHCAVGITCVTHSSHQTKCPGPGYLDGKATPSLPAVIQISFLLSSIIHGSNFIIKAGVNKKLNVICKGGAGRLNSRAAFWFQAKSDRLYVLYTLNCKNKFLNLPTNGP